MMMRTSQAFVRMNLAARHSPQKPSLAPGSFHVLQLSCRLLRTVKVKLLHKPCCNALSDFCSCIISGLISSGYSMEAYKFSSLLSKFEGFVKSFLRESFHGEGTQAAQAEPFDEELAGKRQEKDSQWPADLEGLIFCESDLLLRPIVTWGASEFKESLLPFRPSVCFFLQLFQPNSCKSKEREFGSHNDD